ncbi:hypothetical protein DER46DRAFT_580086 [Fusarium sp. MPI-SDFR-AT-0072]|nr:hypothetical protein DER46DRAFT_580086 [Fusarium sp. MPI-SDFR-AT-0072]
MTPTTPPVDRTIFVLAQRHNILAQTFGVVGISPNAPRYLRTGLELAGFKNIVCEEFFIPLGQLVMCPEYKEMGLILKWVLQLAIEPMTSRVLRIGLNYGPYEVRTLAQRFRRALKDFFKEKNVFKVLVVHYQKCKALGYKSATQERLLLVA